MNRRDVLKFIEENDDHIVSDYYDKCYAKLNELNKRIDKISLYMVIIVFLYLIASSTTISSIQIGPVTISDASLLTKTIPVLFAFLLLQLVVISSQKGELFTVVKFIFLAKYKQDISKKDLDNDHNNLFTRLLLPFSYSTELLKFNSNQPNFLNSCIGAILVLPLMSLILLPFFFEYYMLEAIWKKHYTEIVGKISFWLSIWIIAYLIYYFMASIIQNYKERRKESA